MPGMENPDWLAYKSGSTEYGRMRQCGRIWQNAAMWQNMAECGNVAEYGRIQQNAVMSYWAQELRLGTSGHFRANP
jgi:hypothetical protein